MKFNIFKWLFGSESDTGSAMQEIAITPLPVEINTVAAKKHLRILSRLGRLYQVKDKGDTRTEVNTEIASLQQSLIDSGLPIPPQNNAQVEALLNLIGD